MGVGVGAGVSGAAPAATVGVGVSGAAPAATGSVVDTENHCTCVTTTKPVSVTVDAEADAVGVKVKLTLGFVAASVCPKPQDKKAAPTDGELSTPPDAGFLAR